MFVAIVHISAQEGMKCMRKMNNKKIPKGYRLKPETHKMIRTISEHVRGDLDYAINSACRKFLDELTRRAEASGTANRNQNRR